MSALNQNLRASPCLASFFEDDIKGQIEDKKREGLKIKNGHIITLKVAKVFKRKEQMSEFMGMYVQQHPNFFKVYQWTGENWQVRSNKGQETVFKFVSKTLSKNDRSHYTEMWRFMG